MADGDPDRVAVVLPGARYTPAGPPLHFDIPTVVLERANHGLEVDDDVHGSLRHIPVTADEVGRFLDAVA